VVALVAGAVETFAARSTFDVRLEADPSAKKLDLYVDPERIHQVLTNLLENANRWADTKIVVRTGIAKDNADGAHDSFWVQVYNDGPAVPAEHQEHIFERFVRLEPDRARNTGGSGLGLAISRALSEAHGGTLVCLPNEFDADEAEAAEAHGATFELRLPVVAPPAEVYAAATEQQDF